MPSHQEQTYNELQGARPCTGRGEIELIVKHVPASACCKAKDIVRKAKFFCKILNKDINDMNFCWLCQNRKEQ